MTVSDLISNVFHFVAVVQLGDKHAAKKKQPVAPRPSAQLVSDSAPIRVASKKAAPSTVAPGRSLKRKELPTPAPAAPSKEARCEHPPSPVAMQAPSDSQIDTRHEPPESSGAEARVVQGTEQEVTRVPLQVPVMLGTLEAERVAQSTGGIRSKAVQAMGIINELVDVAEQSQSHTAELEGKYNRLHATHTRLKELSNQLRNLQKVWMNEVAAQKAKAEEAMQREAEAEARAQQQIAAAKVEVEKRAAERTVEVEK